MKKGLVIIILLSICVLGLGGLVVYDKFIKDEPVGEELKNDNSDKENNVEQNNEDAEIQLVKEELQKLEIALNKEINDWGSACFNLSNSFINYSDVEEKEFFSVMGPFIMQCLYEKQYTVIVGPILDMLLFSFKELSEFHNYFNIDLEMKSFDDSYYSEEMMDLNPNLTDYFNDDYVIVSVFEQTMTGTPYEYRIDNIYKNDNYYVATITMETVPGKSAYSVDEIIIYEGTIKVSIVDNHLRYEPLYFKKQD